MADRRPADIESVPSPNASPAPARDSTLSTLTLALSDSPPSTANSKSTSTSRPRSKSLLSSLNTSSGHKRTSSGNLLSKFPFFRTNSSSTENTNTSSSNATTSTPSNAPSRSSSEAAPASSTTSNNTTIPFPSSPIATASDSEPSYQNHQQRNPVLASVIEAQSKTRKRKGSLRKTAILMGNHLRLDHRRSPSSAAEKEVSSPKRSPTYPPQLPTPPGSPTKRERKGSQTSPTRKTFAFELPSANSSSDTFSGSAEPESAQPQIRLTLDTITSQATSATKAPTLLSPISSPIGPEASVPSDDDIASRSPPSAPPPPPPALTTHNLLTPVPLKMPSPSPSPPSSESSMTAPHQSPPIPRRRKPSLNKPSLTSPLAAPIIGPGADFPTDEWDYSETEWWGWIILVVTWIVVVVGMGSCLGVWSWAWDVGRTPYAPPELEDDPTLPIVGYYPALMVLTAVMSWVWVVVAWVGMKYFKHAKIQSEDS